jgi:hypothetical protein
LALWATFSYNQKREKEVNLVGEIAKFIFRHQEAFVFWYPTERVWLFGTASFPWRLSWRYLVWKSAREGRHMAYIPLSNDELRKKSQPRTGPSAQLQFEKFSASHAFLLAIEKKRL